MAGSIPDPKKRRGEVTVFEKTNVVDVAGKLEGYYTHLPLGEVDNYSVYISRFKGRYRFHHHHKDEMYLVLEGQVVIEYPSGPSVILNADDILVVKAGTEHRSASEGGALVLMFKNSGMFAEG
jgi:mannose-6-phosphate isomerase-like protein (cupin superfamily)